jgi:hypothetical protein
VNIELHIEELVLNGFEPHQRHEIAEALRARLGEVLVERGIPGGLTGDVDAIDAGTVTLGTGTLGIAPSPARTGSAAADAIYRGFAGE